MIGINLHKSGARDSFVNQRFGHTSQLDHSLNTDSANENHSMSRLSCIFISTGEFWENLNMYPD